VSALLGLEVSATEVTATLESLGLGVMERDADRCTVSVPTFRGDLEIEADLIEEVARMHGLDAVPAALPMARINPDVRDDRARALAGCRSSLMGMGLAETVNYSFVSEALLDRFSPVEKDRRVALPNPVSADYAILRDSLIPQMVDALGRNFARQTETAACFEMGRVFLRGEGGAIREEERIGVGLLGKAGRSGLDIRRPVDREEMFLWVKGIVEGLLQSQGVTALDTVPCEAPALEPGWTVRVEVGGRSCGLFGLLRPDLRTQWRIAEPVGVAELDLEAVLAHSGRVPQPKPVPAYPGISRDMALVVDEAVRHADVRRVVMKVAPPELTSLELFDIFRSKAIGAGKKSLAYSLVYRSLERTLTDTEANGFHEAIKAALRSELNAEIRES